eukprot:6049854-Pleurochrysis_carterae.AAC.1
MHGQTVLHVDLTKFFVFSRFACASLQRVKRPAGRSTLPRTLRAIYLPVAVFSVALIQLNLEALDGASMTGAVLTELASSALEILQVYWIATRHGWSTCCEIGCASIKELFCAWALRGYASPWRDRA